MGVGVLLWRIAAAIAHAVEAYSREASMAHALSQIATALALAAASSAWIRRRGCPRVHSQKLVAAHVLADTWSVDDGPAEFSAGRG
ncbi:hypothetical protein T492DRAFT_1105842 [Pavlovales sp. CCMP2436]|nr:hypothetical protein T492DRAFT_1105842 [Pavlovales sp. CCMP2436]